MITTNQFRYIFTSVFNFFLLSLFFCFICFISLHDVSILRSKLSKTFQFFLTYAYPPYAMLLSGQLYFASRCEYSP